MDCFSLISLSHFLKKGGKFITIYASNGLTNYKTAFISICNFCIFVKINILCMFMFNGHITRFVIARHP